MSAGVFNPAALLGGADSFDEVEVVPLSEEEIRRVSTPILRRKLAGLRMGAGIVSMATSMRGDMDDESILKAMHGFVARMSAIRAQVLAACGVDKASSEFPVAFNAATAASLEVAASEWRFARLGEGVRPFPVETVGKLLDLAGAGGPLMSAPRASLDLATTRRLAALATLTKMWSAVNMFDYFQPDPQALVVTLSKAVAYQAEEQSKLLCRDDMPSSVTREIVRHMHGVSASLMVEVYKAEAMKTVTQLAEMPELDRSVHLAMVEGKGMTFDHVIDAHRSVMVRALDTAKLILEAQGEPQPAMEQSYA
jgi:hypothetical protein